MTGFERASGVLLPVASLPGGRLGDDALRFVDWLADAGQTWWQILPFGPPDGTARRTPSPSAFAGAPTWLGRDRTRRSPPTRSRRSSRPIPYWIGDWAAFAGPGALADQVRFDREWSPGAHARGRARRAHPRRHAVLRRARRAPITAATPSCSARRGRRGAARRLERRRPALGHPGLRLGGDARPALPLVDRAVPPDASSSSTRSASTTSAGSSPTGVIPDRNRTARAGPWVRGPGRAVFDAVRERARRLPGRRREPRRHHARGRAPAPRARHARDRRAAVRVQRRVMREPAARAARSTATPSSTRAPTTTTPPSGGGRRAAETERERSRVAVADAAARLDDASRTGC